MVATRLKVRGLRACRSRFSMKQDNVEENRGEESREDKEVGRRNADEETDDPFVFEDPFVAAFYQCLNSCVGLVLKGNPTSPSSLEELLHNSIRNVEIAGGKAVAVLALQRVVGGFMSAAEEWRSLRAACSAPLAEEAGAQRGAARKALEALSEEVTQLQARADQISNAREAKSLAKETAGNAVLNAQTVIVRAQKIIAEQWAKVNLLEEEVAKLLQEQNQVEVAVAEKKAAMAAAQARLENSAALAEAESRKAREALQEQLAAREAAMKALVRQ